MAVEKRWNFLGYDIFIQGYIKQRHWHILNISLSTLQEYTEQKRKRNFQIVLKKTIHNTKWNATTDKVVSKKDQDLVDTIEAHKSMP